MINIHRGVSVHVVVPEPGESASDAARNHAAVIRDTAPVIVHSGDNWCWVAVGGEPVEAVWVPLQADKEDDAVEEIRKVVQRAAAEPNGITSLYHIASDLHAGDELWQEQP